MTTSALITMLLVLGTVVGGFVGFLALALRSEGHRAERVKRGADER